MSSKTIFILFFLTAIGFSSFAQQPDADLWPVTKFHFLVSFQAGDMKEDVFFQEVTGLDAEYDIIEYRGGNSKNSSTTKMPGLKKVTNVTLKKGVFLENSKLLQLFNTIVSDQPNSKVENRMTVQIKLLDESGSAIMSWDLKNAFPTKLSVTELMSGGNEVAVETLELTHEGLSLKMSGN